jgi:hypothetical protein
MPLSLSDAELTAVMDAAAPIPRRDRDQFLRDVAAELARYPELGPGIVGRVVREVQRRYFDPPQFHGGKFVVERRKTSK